MSLGDNVLLRLLPPEDVEEEEEKERFGDKAFFGVRLHMVFLFLARCCSKGRGNGGRRYFISPGYWLAPCVLHFFLSFFFL